MKSIPMEEPSAAPELDVQDNASVPAAPEWITIGMAVEVMGEEEGALRTRRTFIRFAASRLDPPSTLSGAITTIPTLLTGYAGSFSTAKVIGFNADGVQIEYDEVESNTSRPPILPVH